MLHRLPSQPNLNGFMFQFTKTTVVCRVQTALTGLGGSRQEAAGVTPQVSGVLKCFKMGEWLE